MERDRDEDVSKKHDNISTKNISTYTSLQELLGAWMVRTKGLKNGATDKRTSFDNILLAASCSRPTNTKNTTNRTRSLSALGPAIGAVFVPAARLVFPPRS